MNRNKEEAKLDVKLDNTKKGRFKDTPILFGEPPSAYKSVCHAIRKEMKRKKTYKIHAITVFTGGYSSKAIQAIPNVVDKAYSLNVDWFKITYPDLCE